MAELEDDAEEYPMELEESASFTGPCTCDHEPEEHGWMECKVDGCPCEAHWEE